MTPTGARAGWSGSVRFLVFLTGYVALFLIVPPIPLCIAGSCFLSPRPEAFLLAAALAFGAGAVTGVAAGGLLAILFYEALHPTGLTLLDGVVAFSVFLAAGGGGTFVLRRWPGPEGALGAGGVVTAAVVLGVGTYGAWTGPLTFLASWVTVLGQALLPINVAGVLFLVAWRRGAAGAGGSGD